MSDTFLTVDEISKQMRVSKMTVYRLIHSGKLAAVQFGRSFRVYESSYLAYLKETESEES